MVKSIQHSPDAERGRLPESVGDHSDDEISQEATQRDIVVEEETDNEQVEVPGYELIPLQESDEEIEFGITEMNGEEIQTTVSSDYHELTTSSNVCNNKEVQDKETTTSTSEPKIPMDNQQIEIIKSVMANIKLPSSAVPPWANVVSDDQLQKLIVEKVNENVNPSCNENWAVFD